MIPMSSSRRTRTLWLFALTLHLPQADLAGQAGNQTGAAMLSTATCPDCVSFQAGLHDGKGSWAPLSRAGGASGRRIIPLQIVDFGQRPIDGGRVGASGWPTSPLQEAQEEDGSDWGWADWARIGGLGMGAVSVGYTTACTVKGHHGLGDCALEGIAVGVALPILVAFVAGLGWILAEADLDL